MECVICKNGSTAEGLATFTLERNGVIVVFKNVPAQVCKNCGDFYLSAQASKYYWKKQSKPRKRVLSLKLLILRPQRKHGTTNLKILLSCICLCNPLNLYCQGFLLPRLLLFLYMLNCW